MDQENIELGTDEELVKKSLQNADCFYYLMTRYEKKLLHYILRLSNINEPTAEDILQEVFMKAYRNLRDFDSRLKFSSWIYRIAHNETISFFRKRKARPETVNIENEDLVHFLKSSFDVHKEYKQQEINAKVQEVIKQLPEKYREVLIMRFIDDLDYQEISDILKKPMGTVSTLINRAKTQFRELAITHKLEL